MLSSKTKSIIIPPIYGLVIYVTIRLVNDTISGFKFWERDWRINIIEITTCILVGYIMEFTIHRLFKYFDSLSTSRSLSNKIFYEVLVVFIVTELVMSLTIIPMAALTDDGLSWGDVATIYIIPFLFMLIYYGISRSAKALKDYIEGKLLLEKITNDKLDTELKLLRAQYHPHFLFNALNTIYFQMDEDVDAAKRSVEKFSELLRYQLYDQQQTVPVSQEIEYLKSFIELQKIRSSEKLSLRANFDSSLNGQHVYPLMFLPLVENAFKYVGGDYWINIEAKANKNQLIFIVENSLPDQSLNSTKGGIGLENLKRRLELLYPNKHTFKTLNNNHQYKTEMTLTLD